MLHYQDHGLDVRLMRVLQILLAECSVSRTAVILGQSQPAVSLALKRLREIIGDPLLVRSGSRLVPTERGLELVGRVERVLSEIDGMVSDDEQFRPATDTRGIRIHAVNCLGTFFLPRIVELLRHEAPLMQIDFCSTPDERVIFSEMESGTIDLVIGNWPLPRENLRFSPLLDTDMVLVLRQDHPMAGRSALTLDEYLALDHLSPTPYVSAAISPVDGRLAQLDKKRRIVLTVPEFTLVPPVLARTDLVFTSSRPFAEQMAATMPFAILEAPPEFETMKFFLLWHERVHQSPCNRWLRGLVRRASGELNELSTLHSRKEKARDIIQT
jgi:DNA-binding transcriptional LysR family regulator